MQTVMISVEDELQVCISQLDLSQKKSLLELIKSFVKDERIIGKPQTIEEYNREIEEAEKRIEAGIFYTQEEVKAMAISLEEYNNELAEAEAEYQQGKSISHEAMLNEMKKW